MNGWRRHALKIGTVLLAVFLFWAFFAGYRDKGPARRKFKKLEGGHEDLIKEEPPPEVNYLKEIAGDHRLKKWFTHWKKFSPELDPNAMEGLGEAFIMEEEMDLDKYDYMMEGPNKQFYVGAPGGKYRLNPYWGRLYYKKKEGDWQPFYDEGCGAVLYESSAKRAIMIVRCSLLEGIDDAFWLDKNRLVLMGYESITRQMSVECETVESCIAPTVWIVNLKTKTMTQYHGGTLQRKDCNVDAYIKAKYPKLFAD